jgi:polar amino acid transport system substrate-binding protein
MRWLLLINALALVLLSGAFAVLIEGTPIGDRVSEILRTGTEPVTRERAPTGEEVISLSLPQSTPVDTGWQSDEPVALEPLPEQVVPILEGDVRLPRSAPGRGATNVQRQPLRIASEGAFLPFNFSDEEGQPAGFDIDIANELCARLKRTCVLEFLPWAQLQPALIAGDVDVLAASMQIPIENPVSLRFTKPYYGAHGRFVTPVDMDANDLMLGGELEGDEPHTSGAQVAVQGNSVHAAYLAQTLPDIVQLHTESFEEALSMVEAGKVEAAFGDNVAALYWLNDRNCCRALAQPITQPDFFGHGVGLVVRDSDGDLLDRINVALDEMILDGTHARLAEKYFGVGII